MPSSGAFWNEQSAGHSLLPTFIGNVFTNVDFSAVSFIARLDRQLLQFINALANKIIILNFIFSDNAAFTTENIIKTTVQNNNTYLLGNRHGWSFED